MAHVIDQTGRSNQDRSNTGGQLSYRRKFTGDDHTLAVNLSHERTDERTSNNFTNVIEQPAGSDDFQSINARNALNQTQLKADYNRPMAEGAG